MSPSTLRLLLLGGLLTSTSAHAGAWTRDLGQHFTRGGMDAYVSHRFENALQDVDEVVRFTSYSASVYSEVGISPAWPLQLTVQVPLTFSALDFKVIDAVDPSEQGRATTSRLGDANLSIQTALLRNKPIELAGALTVKIPLYRLDGIGRDQGAWTDVFPRPGDGQIDVTPWVWLGGGFPSGFYEVGVGYRFRTEAFIGEAPEASVGDGIPFHAKLGLHGGRVWGIAEVLGIKNFRDDLFTREHVAVGATVMVQVWKGLAVDARVAPEIWTRKASQGVSWSLGLSWQSGQQ